VTQLLLFLKFLEFSKYFQKLIIFWWVVGQGTLLLFVQIQDNLVGPSGSRVTTPLFLTHGWPILARAEHGLANDFSSVLLRVSLTKQDLCQATTLEEKIPKGIRIRCEFFKKGNTSVSIVLVPDMISLGSTCYFPTSALNISNISSVLELRPRIELSLIHWFLAGQYVWEQFDEVSAVCSFPFHALYNRVCSRPRAGFVWDKSKFNSR